MNFVVFNFIPFCIPPGYCKIGLYTSWKIRISFKVIFICDLGGEMYSRL